MNTLILCIVFFAGFAFGAVAQWLYIRPKAKKLLQSVRDVTDILEQVKKDVAG